MNLLLMLAKSLRIYIIKNKAFGNFFFLNQEHNYCLRVNVAGKREYFKSCPMTSEGFWLFGDVK